MVNTVGSFTFLTPSKKVLLQDIFNLYRNTHHYSKLQKKHLQHVFQYYIIVIDIESCFQNTHKIYSDYISSYICCKPVFNVGSKTDFSHTCIKPLEILSSLVHSIQYLAPHLNMLSLMNFSCCENS